MIGELTMTGAIVKAASVVTALGTIGGGALILDSRHAPMSVMSDLAVGQVLDLVDRARQEPDSDWLCQATEEELIKLCSRTKGHYLCRVDVQKDLKRKAGCDG